MQIYNAIQSRRHVCYACPKEPHFLEERKLALKLDYSKLGWFIDGKRLDNYVMSMEEMEALNKLFKEWEVCQHKIAKKYCKAGCNYD